MKERATAPARRTNANAYEFGSLPAGLCTSPPVPPCADSRFSTVTEVNTNAVSNYNGMVISFKHQFTGWGQGISRRTTPIVVPSPSSKQDAIPVGRAGCHFPEGRLLGKQELQLRQPCHQPGCDYLDGRAVASRSTASQTLWPSAGSKSAGPQAAAWCAVGLHPLHQFLRELGGCFAVGHSELPQADDRTRSLDSVFWSPACNVCSGHDSRLCECIPQLEDARQVDMGEAARYRDSPFLRGPDAVFNYLETHELQRALLNPKLNPNRESVLTRFQAGTRVKSWTYPLGNIWPFTSISEEARVNSANCSDDKA